MTKVMATRYTVNGRWKIVDGKMEDCRWKTVDGRLWMEEARQNRK